MKKIKKALLVAMATSTLALLGCGAEAGGGAAPTDAQRQAYEREVLTLKGAQGTDYDARLAELQAKYGIGHGETSDLERPKATSPAKTSGESLGQVTQA